MLILNFSHPLTQDQSEQLETITGQKIDQVVPIPVQFDNAQPFLPQLHDLLSQMPLTSEQLQTTPILIVPPALNFITALLLAELHGRMGYFAPIVRIRPVAGSTPLRFEVAEILNLQAVREDARKTR